MVGVGVGVWRATGLLRSGHIRDVHMPPSCPMLGWGDANAGAAGAGGLGLGLGQWLRLWLLLGLRLRRAEAEARAGLWGLTSSQLGLPSSLVVGTLACCASFGAEHLVHWLPFELSTLLESRAPLLRRGRYVRRFGCRSLYVRRIKIEQTVWS